MYRCIRDDISLRFGQGFILFGLGAIESHNISTIYIYIGYIFDATQRAVMRKSVRYSYMMEGNACFRIKKSAIIWRCDDEYLLLVT